MLQADSLNSNRMKCRSNAMQRVKTKKKKSANIRPDSHIDGKTAFEFVKQTNIYNFAVFTRILTMEYHFTKDELLNVLESYLAHIEEVKDHRCTAVEFIKDTIDLTGIDIEKELETI